nr:unnamed protein product [Callosobruchus analis]
MDFLEVMLGG